MDQTPRTVFGPFGRACGGAPADGLYRPGRRQGLGVPKRNDSSCGIVVFVPENTDARRIDHEMPSRESRQADPSRGQNASELPMREQRYIPFEIEQFLKQPVSAIRDLLGGFAVRASVSPNIPVRSGFADVDGELSLVIAIVPLLQIRREFRRRRESRPIRMSVARAGSGW